jgi:hypothetical protein
MLISCEVHHNYFHESIAIGSNILYLMYVHLPKTVEGCQTHMHQFQLAGFKGTIGSTDATHAAISTQDQNSI